MPESDALARKTHVSTERYENLIVPKAVLGGCSGEVLRAAGEHQANTVNPLEFFSARSNVTTLRQPWCLLISPIK